MTSLNLYSKAVAMTGVQNKPAQLYRKIIREIPRVLMIYQLVNIGEDNARQAIKNHFYERKDIEDIRIIKHCLKYGYYELEETLLQHKQKNHLIALLHKKYEEPHLGTSLRPDATFEQVNATWLE